MAGHNGRQWISAGYGRLGLAVAYVRLVTLLTGCSLMLREACHAGHGHWSRPGVGQKNTTVTSLVMLNTSRLPPLLLIPSLVYATLLVMVRPHWLPIMNEEGHTPVIEGH